MYRITYEHPLMDPSLFKVKYAAPPPPRKWMVDHGANASSAGHDAALPSADAGINHGSKARRRIDSLARLAPTAPHRANKQAETEGGDIPEGRGQLSLKRLAHQRGHAARRRAHAYSNAGAQRLDAPALASVQLTAALLLLLLPLSANDRRTSERVLACRVAVFCISQADTR